jgi:hypothetical protein
MKHGPHWENHCEHPTNSFVGTIRDTSEHEVVDVYVYKQRVTHLYKVCLRYGEQADKYLTPYGDVGTFLYNTDSREEYSTDTYRLAAKLIHDRCEFIVNIKQMEERTGEELFDEQGSFCY